MRVEVLGHWPRLTRAVPEALPVDPACQCIRECIKHQGANSFANAAPYDWPQPIFKLCQMIGATEVKVVDDDELKALRETDKMMDEERRSIIFEIYERAKTLRIRKLRERLYGTAPENMTSPGHKSGNK